MIAYVVMHRYSPAEVSVFAVMTTAAGAADAARVALAQAPDAEVVVLEYAVDQLPADARSVLTLAAGLPACCPACAEVAHDPDCVLVGDGRPVNRAG